MPELHPSLAGRWSPRAFETRHDIGRADLITLLEAARWAPSAGNTQPWRFVVGRRDDEAHKHIFSCLDRDEQRWAWRASALIVAAYTTSDGIPADRAAYDLGHAIAHLGVQATALRLHTHQMSRFDPDMLRDELSLPVDVVPHAVVAVGRLGDPTTLPEDLRLLEFRLRERRPVQQLLLACVL